MPKEVVYGSDVPFGTPEEPLNGRSIVEVRWDRETGYFQIATKCVDAATGGSFEQVVPEGPIPVSEGWHVELDRGGINRLIRNLRRARDQAFGRDE